MSDHGPAKNPCGSCPYRLDVPSGVWAASEYEKLPAYDEPTHAPPVAPFYCHQQNGRLCAGWVGCHDMDEALALRFGMLVGLSLKDVDAARTYVSPVPLHESGTAAALHGLKGVDAPGPDAQRLISRLMRKMGDRLIKEDTTWPRSEDSDEPAASARPATTRTLRSVRPPASDGSDPVSRTTATPAPSAGPGTSDTAPRTFNEPSRLDGSNGGNR